MGWRDRDYNRPDSTGGFSHPLWRILFGSVPLGTWFGIHVRMHASLVLLIVLRLVFAGTGVGAGSPKDVLILTTALFFIVLLHEFGHCFAARWMGGEADEILMWPLGGLATTRPPHRPWPTFVTVAAGPLVNVIICVVSGGIIWALSPAAGMSLANPLRGLFYFDAPMTWLLPEGVNAFTRPEVRYASLVYMTSYMLLLFNLLPIYPLDGGQMLNAILWPKFGYYKATLFSCTTGMVGAAIMAAMGLAGAGAGRMDLWLVFLGLAGFMYCYQMRTMLKASGPMEFESEMDYSAAYETQPVKHRKLRKGWFRSAARKAARDRAEQAKIDAILAKVHEKGMHSLTWWEKRALHKATERQRQQDLAERL